MPLAFALVLLCFVSLVIPISIVIPHIAAAIAAAEVEDGVAEDTIAHQCDFW